MQHQLSHGWGEGVTPEVQLPSWRPHQPRQLPQLVMEASETPAGECLAATRHDLIAVPFPECSASPVAPPARAGTAAKGHLRS